MRLLSSWTVPGGATSMSLVVFLVSLFTLSNSSPTGLVLRDSTDWVGDEIICSWNRPQSAIFREMIFIDGGSSRRQLTLENGTTELLNTRTNLLYFLNLTHPFSITDNQSRIIQTIRKPDDNMGTDFTDGFMLANDYEFMVYGGYLDYLDEDAAIGPNWGLARAMVQNGETPLRSNPGGFRALGLSEITRYITAGASVNVPSENKGYVFSGATGVNWGPFYTTSGITDLSLIAYGNSTNLISVDMSVMYSETWSNDTMPTSILPRKSAELVWIPVGAQGTLVAIGGSVNRDGARFREDLYADYRVKGQSFVDNVHLYDIANKKWYTQKTFGAKLPPTSEFCTVVASSADRKSHQIYAYGGHEDVTNLPRQVTPANANVYVLSLPSFQWIQVYDGSNTDHARKGHRCQKVSDNHMMVVGGAPANTSFSTSCVKGGIVRLFNLNTAQWEDKYDPSIIDTYKVPTAVQKVIGGSETGGATLSVEKYDEDGIRELFAINYTKAIPTYWPFPSIIPTDSGTILTPTSSPVNGSGGMPSYVPPLLGAILGLLGVIIILCGILFWIRRKKQKLKRLQSDSAASTARKDRQTWSWLLGVYGDEKRGGFGNPTPGSEHRDPFDRSALVSPLSDVLANPMDRVVETDGHQVYEMSGDSIPQELPTSPTHVKKVTISEEVAEMGNGHKPDNMKNTGGSDQQLSHNTDIVIPVSTARREEARQERGLDPQVLQRLLEDPRTSLRED